MRPIANFTFHAILAAAIAALATTSAAAQATLKLGTESVGGSPQAAKGDRPRIAVLEVQAFRWGTTSDSASLGSWAKADGLDVSWDVAEPAGRVNKVDSFSVKQKTVEQGANSAYAPGNTKYSNVKLSRGSSSTETTGGVAVASGDVTGDGSAAASGLPTGKRQHKPFTLTKPLGKGSVWIRVASPWTGCRVGARYPTLVLSDGTTNYRLVGATISSCGTAPDTHELEKVAFTYQKLDLE